MPRNRVSKAYPEEINIPLYEEQASIVKRRIVAGRVRISIVTREHEQLIGDVPGCEHWEIERNPIGNPAKPMPKVREESGAIIIPIVEEILVVDHRPTAEKQVRVRHLPRNGNHREYVVLHRQEAVITSIPPSTQPIDQLRQTAEHKGEDR